MNHCMRTVNEPQPARPAPTEQMERQGVAYERAVRRGYLEQAKAEPDRYLVIDASGDTDTVFAGLCNALTERVDVLGGGKASRQLED